MPTHPGVFSFHGCSVQSSIAQQTQTSYPCSCYCHYWKWFVCIARSPWTASLFVERMGRELRLYWDPCTCQTLCEEFFLHSCLIFNSLDEGERLKGRKHWDVAFLCFCRRQGCLCVHAHRGRKITLLSAPCSVGQRHHHRDLSSHCFDSGEAQGNEGGSPESLEEGVFFGGVVNSWKFYFSFLWSFLKN